jgi:hypothetical protein
VELKLSPVPPGVTPRSVATRQDCRRQLRHGTESPPELSHCETASCEACVSSRRFDTRLTTCLASDRPGSTDHRIEPFLHLLARLESDHQSFRHRYCLSGARVARLLGLSALDLEHAKASKLQPPFSNQRLDNAVENLLDDFRRAVSGWSSRTVSVATCPGSHLCRAEGASPGGYRYIAQAFRAFGAAGLRTGLIVSTHLDKINSSSAPEGAKG